MIFNAFHAGVISGRRGMADTELTEEAHARLLTDRQYQLELPDGRIPDIEPDIPRADTGPGLMDWLFDAVMALGPLFRVLLMLAAGVLVLYVAFSVFQAIRKRKDIWWKSARGKIPEDQLAGMDIRPDEAFARDLLSEADKLAAEGRYAEAVRLILQSSIRDMQERVKQKIGISFTAREVGGLGRLPDGAREALRRIIARVEVSVFGEASVDAEGYKATREDYTEFALQGARS